MKRILFLGMLFIACGEKDDPTIKVPTSDEVEVVVGQYTPPSVDLARLRVAATNWCPVGDEVLLSFDVAGGKTVSICRSDDPVELSYYYGYLGSDPELKYTGPILGTVGDLVGYSFDLATLGRYGFGESVSTDVSQETIDEIAKAADSNGFIEVYSRGLSEGAENSYIFRRGGWEYAVRVGYSRNVNPDIAANIGDFSHWAILILISPDGKRYMIRGGEEPSGSSVVPKG